MKLSKKTVRAIVALIVLSLGGLVYLQFRLLMNTIELKEQTFKRNVFAAMNAASEKLEEVDARNRLFLFDTTDSHSFRVHVLPGKNDSSVKFTLKKARDSRARVEEMHSMSWREPRQQKTDLQVTRTSPKVNKETSFVGTAFTTTTGPDGELWLATRLSGNRLSYQLSKPQRVSVKAFDVLGRLDTTYVDEFKPEGEHQITIPAGRYPKGIYYVQVKTDSATSMIRWESGKIASAFSVGSDEARKGKVLKRVVESFADSRLIPIHERYSKELIDSILHVSLQQQAIALPFEFGIAQNESLAIARTALSYREIARSEYQRSLLNSDPFHEPEILYIHFPTYRSYLFGELFPEMGASLFLIAVIIFCFVYTIRTIFRQKEFAGRLSDFINNMTHEFKTPISTIALASEAIARPDVSQSEQKLQRYNGVIADEIMRMKNQVEKILQMAALEEGDYEFNMAPVDMHQVIARAAENAALQVSAQKGTVTTQLAAKKTKILADAVHIENVIHSLLDNAVKYSPNEPAISIETIDENGKLVIRVRDNGIGISEENLGKVFDKYYRVPTGNLHDVKGFGIGLSYVKLIAEAHNGSVAIISRVGKGTTVELKFPFPPNNESAER